MRTRNLVMAALMAAVLASSAAPLGRPAQAAVSPASGIGIRLVDGPMTAPADSRAWSYIIDRLATGAVIHRRIQVSNTTDSTQHISLYAAAAQFADRQVQFAPGRTPDELSSWITMNRNGVTLAPHTRSMVVTTVTVPDRATPGERYAVIWAEAAKAAPTEGGLAEVNRVGIRVYLSVGSLNTPASAFVIESLTARRLPDNRQILLVRIRNTGAAAIDLSGDLTLTNGPGRMSAGPFRIAPGTTLAPGQSGTVTVPLGRQLPDGPWHAQIRLQSGLTKATAEATIRFPPATVKAETSPYSIAVIASGVLLAALVAAWFLLIRPRRRSRARDAVDE